MDGIPPHDLWDLVIANQINKTQNQELQGNSSQTTTIHMKNQNPTKHVNLDLYNADHVASDVRPSRFGAMLQVFEDNEAVIQMITKGRSPTKRRVSRTHRVARDWLFERINWDRKIQIKYIDTKHQQADIWTEGNFTRDKWNNLLNLCNISHFSSLCCAQNFSFTRCLMTMATRMQEQKEEDRVAAKSMPTAINLTSTASTSSSSVNHPITSKSPGILRAFTRKPDARARRHSKPDAASSSQGRLFDAYLGGWMVVVGGKLAATDFSQESWEVFSNLNPGATTRKKYQGNLMQETVSRAVFILFFF